MLARKWHSGMLPLALGRSLGFVSAASSRAESGFLFQQLLCYGVTFSSRITWPTKWHSGMLPLALGRSLGFVSAASSRAESGFLFQQLLCYGVTFSSRITWPFTLRWPRSNSCWRFNGREITMHSCESSVETCFKPLPR